MISPRLSSIGLIGQMVAILLLAILVEFLISTALYERASQFTVRDDDSRRIAEHLVVARRLVNDAPPDRRPGLVAELSTDHYQIRWDRSAPVASLELLSPMRSKMIGWEPGLASNNLRLALVSVEGRAHVEGSIALDDRSWIHLRLARVIGEDDWPAERILTAAIIALVVMLAGGLLMRRALYPMRRLAKAADRFGHGAAEHLEETGPDEVRHVIAAFNRLQGRITGLIADRTQALAAAGHDLRTPLARLRLRTDSVNQAELRVSMSHDIAEMEAMIASLMTYLGGETDTEATALSDIAVLCATLADDAADMGRDVVYDGPDHCEILARPLGLKRAISNLLENAIHYADHVSIGLQDNDLTVVVTVDDDGPGIPEHAIARVLEPFTRLDAARRRDTVGLGLGLAIVSRAIALERGTLRLSNRPEGGLRAEITLNKANASNILLPTGKIAETRAV